MKKFFLIFLVAGFSCNGMNEDNANAKKPLALLHTVRKVAGMTGLLSTPPLIPIAALCAYYGNPSLLWAGLGTSFMIPLLSLNEWGDVPKSFNVAWLLTRPSLLSSRSDVGDFEDHHHELHPALIKFLEHNEKQLRVDNVGGIERAVSSVEGHYLPLYQVFWRDMFNISPLVKDASGNHFITCSQLASIGNEPDPLTNALALLNQHCWSLHDEKRPVVVDSKLSVAESVFVRNHSVPLAECVAGLGSDDNEVGRSSLEKLTAYFGIPTIQEQKPTR